MNNLSFHITDITANSIRANASEIGLHIEEQDAQIIIRITDDGSGMDEETVARITNPFYTTRTTRKVGLGIPFLIQNAEQTGGLCPLHPSRERERRWQPLSIPTISTVRLGGSSGNGRYADHRQSGY